MSIFRRKLSLLFPFLEATVSILNEAQEPAITGYGGWKKSNTMEK